MSVGIATFELNTPDEDLLMRLRKAGITAVERLGSGYVNVTCYEQYTDAVEEILDDSGIGYRLVF